MALPIRKRPSFHSLEKEMATHSSVLAWRIPGTGEPGGLLSMGLHRVGHDWSDLACRHCGYRRRQWHPTPVLLPGKSHGWRSLVGCSPWGRKESDTTERLHFHFSLSCIGEGDGNPFQCSCLENPRDGGAWWLPSVGSHRVGHDWSDLAAAAALWLCNFTESKIGLYNGCKALWDRGPGISLKDCLRLSCDQLLFIVFLLFFCVAVHFRKIYNAHVHEILISSPKHSWHYW